MKASEIARTLYHNFYYINNHQNSVLVRSEIAANCVIEVCNVMEKELQGHTDLYGYWQDETERMTIIQRINLWREVKDEAERMLYSS